MADSENSVSERMRADWNQRAREDAHYYVAFGRKGQDDEEFFATAGDVVRTLEESLKQQGMVFATPDHAAFHDTLVKSGFYKTWQAKFGPALWSALEKFTGPLA